MIQRCCVIQWAQAVVWCSCYYPGYFNALKRYPIPTPGVGLHNFTLIISVIIGGIPPGGIFWEKIPGLTSTHYCAKALFTFPQSFPHIHALGGTYGLHHATLYISTIYSCTQSITFTRLSSLHSLSSSSPPSHPFPFTTLSNLSNHFLSLSYIISIIILYP